MPEQSLHEELKEWYSKGGNLVEETLDGYIIDVIRYGLLIEIQTGNFSSIKTKLEDLLEDHRVRLVYPIPYRKWIIKLDEDSRRIDRRKSPKRGKVEEVFYELVYIPELCNHPNFELEVALVDIDEFWIDDGRGSWRRRRWSIHDRKLLHIHETLIFKAQDDYLNLLPKDLPNCFTSKQLSEKADITTRLAQKIVYCLRKMDTLKIHGKKGRSNLYRLKRNQ